jgi:TIR domain
MTGIFINYRSADGRVAAEAIYRGLAASFGPENVFLDKRDILPGVAYPGKIRSWIHDRCSVMLAVIGPGWLDAKDGNGTRLLFCPRDWVHDEIADALALGVPVLPVPIYDTPLPAAKDLPDTIAALVTRNEMRIRHFDQCDDVKALIRSVEALDPGLTRGGHEAGNSDMPPWADRTSDFLYRSAAHVYSIAYKAEIGAPLIRLTQALGGTTAGAAAMLGRMPARKAAATLEAMDRPRALLVLRAMEPHRRRLIVDHLPADMRYLMAADDYGNDRPGGRSRRD